MFLDGVESAQRVLRAVAGYRGPIDGLPGSGSLAAAERITGPAWRDAAGAGDWGPARRVIAAAQVALDREGHRPGPPDGYWGPQTDAAFSAWRGDALPDRRPAFGYQSEMTRIFGEAGGPQCTAGRINVPWAMVLAWDTSTPISVIRCHELLAASGQRVFDKIAAEYSPVAIRDLGLHLFGGCYNFRPMRGGSSLSTHAWGAAIDLDPARNRLRWNASQARLARTDARRFWAIWESEGWHSLGRARDYDWMHVQAPAP